MRHRRNGRGRTDNNDSQQRQPSAISMYFEKAKMITVPLVANSLPFWVSLYCLYMYYTEVTDQEWNKLTYVAFIITLVNSLIGFPWFNDESYTDLKVLLDYAQEILPLPCICTEIWFKHEVIENTMIVYAHSILGFAAFAFLVLYEYKRMDLTDLTMIANTASLFAVAVYFNNWFALAALTLCSSYYFVQKRTEACCLKHKYTFDHVMALVNILALFAFEPKKYVPSFLEGITDMFGGSDE